MESEKMKSITNTEVEEKMNGESVLVMLDEKVIIHADGIWVVRLSKNSFNVELQVAKKNICSFITKNIVIRHHFFNEEKLNDARAYEIFKWNFNMSNR